MITLREHTKPITKVQITQDNVYTASKDSTLCKWGVDGTLVHKYKHHNGALKDFIIDKDVIITASSDGYMFVGDVKLEIYDPIKSIANNDTSIYVLKKKLGKPTSSIVKLENNVKQQETDLPVEANAMTITTNQLLCGNVCGELIIHSLELQHVHQMKIHKLEITQVYADESQNILITSSLDKTVKLHHLDSLECFTTIAHCVPVLTFDVHLVDRNIAIGGGQDKMSVALTSSHMNQFNIDVYKFDGHKLYTVATKHFGPINCISYSGNGKHIASGGEDGYTYVYSLEQQDKNNLANNQAEIETLNKKIQELAGPQHKNVRKRLNKKVHQLEQINARLRASEN